MDNSAMSNPFSGSTSKPKRSYDASFESNEEYRASLPDMQNAESAQILGSNVRINQVGI